MEAGARRPAQAPARLGECAMAGPRVPGVCRLHGLGAFRGALDRLVADATEDNVRHPVHDGRLQAHPPTPAAHVDASGILVYDVGTTPRLPS